MNKNFDIILFDLGGVLIEIGGITEMLSSSSLPIDEGNVWDYWLACNAVQIFERGHSSPVEFASSIVRELQLSVDADTFLADFYNWPRGLFPDTDALLEKVHNGNTLGCLSNSNGIHWPRFVNEMHIDRYLSHIFLSHEIGSVKPEKEIYRHVIKTINIDPERILYFDDNQVNVDAGNEAGMTCYRVKGNRELTDKLEELGVL